MDDREESELGMMSALGHLQTLASELGMSALALKADMLSVSINAR